jgi:hypothetical protein
VDAINNCPQLEIKSDNSMEDLRQAANKFKERSAHGLFKFCTEVTGGPK